MCASCISLLLILVVCALRMGTDGLPLNRRERGVHQDLIAGADFLSILMESPALRQAYRELSTTELPPITRLSRSTPSIGPYDFSRSFFQSIDDKESSNVPKLNSTDRGLLISFDTELPTVSTPHTIEPYTLDVTTTKESSNLIQERSSVLSSEIKDFRAEAATDAFPNNYPRNTDTVIPNFHEVTQSQSIIYHHNPPPTNNGPSISYSTVIQNLPNHPPLNWNDEQHNHHGERKERNYDIRNPLNENRLEKHDVKYRNKPFPNWEKPEQPYGSTEKNWGIPEKNHGLQGKPYSTPTAKVVANQHFPIIYGKSEENYEVDEAVSVMSSGRVHGVQSTTKNDQKVGYVVEGRNYRKYRVEERTSDGFIVGEYGVVSHDDGSLRGVRYTADGNINPRIVYDALMKFLSL